MPTTTRSLGGHLFFHAPKKTLKGNLLQGTVLKQTLQGTASPPAASPRRRIPSGDPGSPCRRRPSPSEGRCLGGELLRGGEERLGFGDEWIGIWFVKGCFHGLLISPTCKWGILGVISYMLYNPLILTFYWWLMLGMMVKISSWKNAWKMIRRLKTWNGPFSGEHLNFPGNKWIRIGLGSNSFPFSIWERLVS